MPELHANVISAEEAAARAQRVGVFPAAELSRRARLFRALEEVTGVRFAGARHAVDDVLISFDEGRTHVSDHLPRGRVISISTSHQAARTGELEFAAGSPLRHLGGPHVAAPTLPDSNRAAGDVVASVDGIPVWLRGSDERLLLTPRELDEGETLRDRLTSQERLPLIALIEFLRDRGPAPWMPPPHHAVFLFDDPNLHRRRYGFVDFESLADCATANGYHAAFAMIPIDAWYASSGAVRLFRDRSDALSLLIHGNDHVRRELGREIGPDAHRRALAQALRRVARFERRYGIRVDRVMAPPHGACSRDAVDQMLVLGYEALAISRSYPWQAAPPADDPAAGARPVESAALGLPLILRTPIARADRQDLALRTFLRQPLVLYGHHDDLAGGPEVLDAAAEVVRDVSGSDWTSLQAIARSRYQTRQTGDSLELRLLSRRVELQLPAGVESLIVSSARVLRECDELKVAVGPNGRVVASVVARDHVRPEAVSPPRPRPWPIARRVLAETRDRVEPLRLRVRGVPKVG